MTEEVKRNIKRTMWLSNALALGALLLLLATYTLKPLFAYHDPTVSREEEESTEENWSFQPFAFFIPKGTPYHEPPTAQLKSLMGDKIWEYHPTGLYAYLIGYKTMPIWRVSLEAPQYPKRAFPHGIPVFFHLTDFTGKVREMDTINHFIGMNPMEAGAVFLRQTVPFIYLFFFILLIAYFFYKGRGWWLQAIIPACMCWYFVFFYAKWLYWFGHHLQPWGMFKVKPFMPTVLGDGKVAQFTTHSYPAVGFYFLLGVFVLLLFSILLRRKALKGEVSAT